MELSRSHLLATDASRSIKRAQAWAYAETHKLCPPIVPVIVAVRRIMEYIGKATIRKKLDFVPLLELEAESETRRIIIVETSS